MLSRFLTFALSFILSMGFVAIIAFHNGPLSFEPFASVIEHEADASAIEDAVIHEVRPVSLGRHDDYLPTPTRGRPIEVSQRQFDRLVSSGLVLVKFGADWCGPCRRVVPELEQLAADNIGLTVLTVDVDREKHLAERYHVGAIPRMILFRDGKQLESWTGFQSARDMQLTVDGANASAPKGDVQQNPFL